MTDVPYAPADESLIVDEETQEVARSSPASDDSGVPDRTGPDSGEPMGDSSDHSLALHPSSQCSDSDDAGSVSSACGRRESLYDVAAILRIVDHRVRGALLTFKVEWADRDIGFTWERLDRIRCYPAILAAYLRIVRDTRKKRWIPLVRKFPDLLRFVKN